MTEIVENFATVAPIPALNFSRTKCKNPLLGANFYLLLKTLSIKIIRVFKEKEIVLYRFATEIIGTK